MKWRWLPLSTRNAEALDFCVTRSTLLPDIPTIAESGVPGFEAVLRYALVAPAGVPRPVIDKLNRALNAALATDEVRKRLALEGAEPVTGT